MKNPSPATILALNRLRNNLSKNEKETIKQSCNKDLLFIKEFDGIVFADSGMDYYLENFKKEIVEEIKKNS